MLVVKSSYEIINLADTLNMLKHIEEVARVCYKSEDRINQDGSSAKDLIGKLIKRGHEAMIEHASITVKFIVDRGVSHELVRHRLASFAQESTRYCDYSKSRDCVFIDPFTVLRNPRIYRTQLTEEDIEELEEPWYVAMSQAEDSYQTMIAAGASPQIARSVLPNSLKTEIIITANLREWRSIFKLRTAAAAHPQMREVMCPLLEELQKTIPVIFDDIIPDYFED